MKGKSFIQSKIFGLFFLILFPITAFPQSEAVSSLKQEFDLAGERSHGTQFYVMKSEYINYALDGERTGTDNYNLYLKWTRDKNGDKFDDVFTCKKFTIKFGDAEETTIPALENWANSFSDGIDQANQVFGIDHTKFENLKDTNGNAIPSDKSYHIYNTFIDFHSFSNVFAERTDEGKGIQNLNKIGQKIVHAAAFSEPPTNLGKNISEGSFFKNGEITLEFKGLSLANDRECALIGFDSGQSSFKMIVKPMPDFEVVAVGSSHYMGDIYKDLASNWVQKINFYEMVVTEATMPMPANKVNSVVERNVHIINVSEAEFFKF